MAYTSSSNSICSIFSSLFQHWVGSENVNSLQSKYACCQFLFWKCFPLISKWNASFNWKTGIFWSESVVWNRTVGLWHGKVSDQKFRATHRQDCVCLFSIKSTGEAERKIVTWFGDLGEYVSKWRVDAYRCATLNTNKKKRDVILVLVLCRFWIVYDKSKVVQIFLLTKRVCSIFLVANNYTGVVLF